MQKVCAKIDKSSTHNWCIYRVCLKRLEVNILTESVIFFQLRKDSHLFWKPFMSNIYHYLSSHSAFIQYISDKKGHIYLYLFYLINPYCLHSYFSHLSLDIIHQVINHKVAKWMQVLPTRPILPPVEKGAKGRNTLHTLKI